MEENIENKSAEKLVNGLGEDSSDKSLMKRRNFKNYFSKNKRMIFVVSLIALVLVVVAGAYLKSNCDGSFCSLTGNVIFQDSSKIVAEFDGGKITSDELDRNYNMFFFLKGLPDTYKSLMPKKTFLNQTISEELLYLEAKKDYEIKNEEIEKTLKDSISKSGLTLDEFKAKLSDANIEYNSVLDFYKKQFIIIDFLNATLFKDIKISDKDAEDYYNQNKEIFKVSEQVKASHILVNSSEEAEEIIRKLNSGEDFAELAKENSIGPSASKGGDLGFFRKGQMVPEFEEAVFSLKKIGDYTKIPIKTQFGYHVIKLTGKQEAKKLSFEESKQDIKKQLHVEKQNKLLKDYIDNLIEKADIKIYEENINEETKQEDGIQSSSNQKIIKSDKPSVELFVMSYCPYGTQAEKGIIPVLELLGDKINSKIKFVHYTMHGEKEDTENFRQLCIREEQSDKYLDYLSCFLEDSDSKRCLKEININENKLEDCISNNAEDYQKEDSEESQGYGVQGSPTLVINGQIVSSGRSSSAFLSTICSTFNDAPEECDEVLDSTNPSPGFGYSKTDSQSSASCGA